MAATAMLNLYTSWDQFDRNDHITFDEDRSVRNIIHYCDYR